MLQGFGPILDTPLRELSVGLAAQDVLLWAEASFPRGPGFYFHPIKLMIVLLVYLAWTRTLWWVDTDSRALNLETHNWNLFLFGGAVLGVLVFWMSPFFLATLLVWCLLYLGPSLAYVQQRNPLVPE